MTHHEFQDGGAQGELCTFPFQLTRTGDIIHPEQRLDGLFNLTQWTMQLS
jgi:hypothetical protein